MNFVLVLQLVAVAFFGWLASKEDLRNKTVKVNLLIVLTCFLINFWFGLFSLVTIYWLQRIGEFGLIDVLVLSAGFVFLNTNWLSWFVWGGISVLSYMLFNLNVLWLKKPKPRAFLPYLLISLLVVRVLILF